MFIGHFGLGFAAKRVQPRLSLGTAFLAAQFLDLLWPTLLLLGVETVRIAPGATAVTPLLFEHYPVSHSLAGALLWGVLVALAHAMATRPGLRTSVLVAALVVSHWLLDAVVHAPDLPLAPGLDLRIGLGLWNSRAGTLLVEIPLFAVGVWLYATATRARDRSGRLALVGLVAFLALVQAANLFGPPPPDVTAIAWAGQAQWLLVAWGYWVDAHRIPVALGPRPGPGHRFFVGPSSACGQDCKSRGWASTQPRVGRCGMADPRCDLSNSPSALNSMKKSLLAIAIALVAGASFAQAPATPAPAAPAAAAAPAATATPAPEHKAKKAKKARKHAKKSTKAAAQS